MDEGRPVATGPQAARHPSNLALRIASALVLGTIAIALDYMGVIAFSLVVLGVVLAMCWEWGTIVRRAGMDLSFLVHASAAGCAIVLAGFGQAALGLVALIIGTIILISLDFSRDGILSALGVPYAGLPGLALVWLRADATLGFQATLFVLVVVWAMDTFALIGGRSIGGPKLWARVSPGKTWAGLVTGAVASLVVGLAFAKVAGTPLVLGAVTGLVLGIVAQGGDLAESALKRLYGVKDSGGLIPGHGGFLDRVDGLAAAAVLAAVIGLVVNAEAPARALLFGY